MPSARAASARSPPAAASAARMRAAGGARRGRPAACRPPRRRGAGARRSLEQQVLGRDRRRRAPGRRRARSRSRARARCPARRARRSAASASGDERELAAGLGGVAREEVARERQDVLAPLAQRRELDRDHVQAEVEVLAEAAGGDLVAQVAVGRRDDAHVDAARLRRRRRGSTSPSCSTRSSFAWKSALDLADLVEEERAAVRALEAAGARRDRRR